MLTQFSLFGYQSCRVLLISYLSPFAGDLLQHFLTVIFTKLDRGETWDDDFELNTILQVMFLN